MLDSRLVRLRNNLRANGKFVIDELIANPKVAMCMFCGSTIDLTKEHVLPKWVFENNPDKGFVTTANEQSQSYNKTVIPACKNCNSFILGTLENYMEQNITSQSKSSHFVQHASLWLELIDYKFQVLNLRRTFLRHSKSDFIPYLTSFPIAMLEHNELTTSQVYSRLRKSQKRLHRKGKKDKENSMVVFKTSNTSFHFFHRTGEFIFLELPKHKIAIFYFLEQEFKTNKLAYDSSMKIIKQVY